MKSFIVIRFHAIVTKHWNQIRKVWFGNKEITFTNRVRNIVC